ncbi:hypothetical protein AC480_00705 [miscellaneous Crenarchaeota group archaeon SMTZ1-55]|nr:MAG: hypothetical protein AC480_00705 [miscellaneous Crenarchaeota group archaeon SMTZ1-55]
MTPIQVRDLDSAPIRVQERSIPAMAPVSYEFRSDELAERQLIKGVRVNMLIKVKKQKYV